MPKAACASVCLLATPVPVPAAFPSLHEGRQQSRRKFTPFALAGSLRTIQTIALTPLTDPLTFSVGVPPWARTIQREASAPSRPSLCLGLNVLRVQARGPPRGMGHEGGAGHTPKCPVSGLPPATPCCPAHAPLLGIQLES